MRRRQLLAALLILLPIVSIRAEPLYLKYRNSFGLKVSNISGYGIFYGHRFLQTWRLQTAGVYYLLDQSIPFISFRHKITNYTIGFDIQKDLFQEEKARLYVSLGGYYYYDNNQKLDETHPSAVKTNSYNWGLGIAYEYYFKRISFGAELGYKIYSDFRTLTENDTKTPEIERITKLGAGINTGFLF